MIAAASTEVLTGMFNPWALVIGVVLLVVNGAFTATEIALLASRRARIEDAGAAGDRRARFALKALSDLPTTFAGAQLGATMSALGLGAIAEPALVSVLGHWFDRWGMSAAVIPVVAVTLGLGVVVFLHMVLGDMAPKNLALARSEDVALALARPFAIFIAVFRPLIALLALAARGVLWVLRIEPVAEHRLVHTPEELALVLTESHEHGTITAHDARMAGAALNLASIDAEAAMTPRVDVVAVADTAGVDELISVARDTGHTRVPVYHRDLDDIVGVVHVKDALVRDDVDGLTLADLLRPISAVPESRDLEQLLFEMLEDRHHIVLVVDEYGGTAGLLSLEDVIEELVGDIADEFDDEPPVERTLDAWMVPGTMRRDELEALTGLDLAESTSDTVSGWMVERLARLLDVGDAVVTGDGWRLEVVTLDRRRAGDVRVHAPADTVVDGA
ncbi:MAG: hemolysin family protein [Nitriliruptoraceae bacterium]